MRLRSVYATFLLFLTFRTSQIKDLTSLSNDGCEKSKLATGVISMLIRHTMYKGESATDEASRGLEAFTLLNVNYVP